MTILSSRTFHFTITTITPLYADLLDDSQLSNNFQKFHVL